MRWDKKDRRKRTTKVTDLLKRSLHFPSSYSFSFFSHIRKSNHTAWDAVSQTGDPGSAACSVGEVAGGVAATD